MLFTIFAYIRSHFIVHFNEIDLFGPFDCVSNVIFNRHSKPLCQAGTKSSRDRYSNASITHCFPEFVFYSIVFISDGARLPSYTGVYVHANSQNNKAML